MSRFIVCLSTASSKEEAERIARKLISGGAAPCVNIVPACLSIYEWKGEVHRDDECLMLIKSTEELFARVAEIVRENHSYEVPEIVAADLEHVSDAYRAYLKGFFE